MNPFTKSRNQPPLFDFLQLKENKIKLGTGGVQGQGKGQRLIGIKEVNGCIVLATCQSKIYEK